MTSPGAATAGVASNGRAEPTGLRSGSARSLLLTVLGELVEPLGEPVWTSSLLHVLNGLGVEDQAARQAIDRAADAGWLTASRHGRNVRWELTATSRALISAGARRIHSLGPGDGSWAGEWLILLVSLPGHRRAVRKRLYGALSWAGFGNPTPGVWLCPHPDRAAEVRAVIAELGLADVTLAFVGRSSDIGMDDRTIVSRSWQLDELAARYEEVLATLKRRRPRAGDPLLFAHLAMVNQMQRFPFLDPQLPEELLGGWIGRRATALFERRRLEWTDAAHHRWREVVALTMPG
jgi:phenylacetic acid degradation operon negative regulatory protein